MLNRIEVIGRVGQDAEFRAMTNGKEVCNLSVAVTDKWRDKGTGEQKERTEWTKWVCFNENLNKIIKSYVKKGDLIRLVGSLQTRSWEDQQGIKKYSTECVIQGFNGELTLLPNAKQESNNDGYRGSSNNNPPPPADDLDESEIPF